MQLTLKDIVKLGDPRLYQICEPVKREELPSLIGIAQDMARLVILYRKKYGAGRAIAAPQVGIMKRLVVLNINEPVFMFNPELSDFSEEKITLWDDCMSFPNLVVRLSRSRSCRLVFRDLNWSRQSWNLEDDFSELLQHECDHLDGILAIDRAPDHRSFQWKALGL